MHAGKVSGWKFHAAWSLLNLPEFFFGKMAQTRFSEYAVSITHGNYATVTTSYHAVTGWRMTWMTCDTINTKTTSEYQTQYKRDAKSDWRIRECLKSVKEQTSGWQGAMGCEERRKRE
jgi:hypothetical protein